MAYYIKYQADWASTTSYGKLYIYEREYFGGITDIKLQDGGIEISNDWKGFDEPIIGLRCEFFVLNNNDDYFDLFELITAVEMQFTVRVVMLAPTPMILFAGYLNTDAISHGYLHYQVMHLVASSYLSKCTKESIASIDNSFLKALRTPHEYLSRTI